MKNVIFVAMIALLLLISQGLMAQLPGWNHYLPITIVETSGTAQFDFQMKLIVDTRTLISTGQMKINENDLRFGNNADGNVLYPYMIESGSNTDSTIIWIRMDSLLGYQHKTIYMFYGNDTATGKSSLNGTFDGPFYAADNMVIDAEDHTSFNINIGFSFKSSSDILVTHFGRCSWASGVTLFDYNKHTEIYGMAIPGYYPDRFYYAPLPKMIWLMADTPYVITVGAAPTLPYNVTTYTTLNNPLTFLDGKSSANYPSTNGFPGTSIGGFIEGFANFKFYKRSKPDSEPEVHMGEIAGQINTLGLAAISMMHFGNVLQLIIPEEIGQGDIYLFNTEGQLIVTMESHTGINTFELGAMPKGVFIMQLHSAAGLFTRKFVNY